MPNNTTEYLFYDDSGILNINEEQVKALTSEFCSLMKQIYNKTSKKYEDIVANIITDADIENIDFPMISVTMTVDSLSKLLPEHIYKKLNITDDEEQK